MTNTDTASGIHRIKTLVRTHFSNSRASRIKHILDTTLPFVLLLVTLLVVFQFVIPVTENIQVWINWANWAVVAYFSTRLAVDYRLSGHQDNFWRQHWLDVIMVIPAVSIIREVQAARLIEESATVSSLSDEVLAGTAFRNTQSAAKLTKMIRLIKRSL